MRGGQQLSLLFLSFFLLLLPNLATSYGVCPVSFCGPLQIRFPFQLTDNINSTTNCVYPGFNLSCSRNQAFIRLPNSGQFTVQNIDYIDQALWVDDPQNCLPAGFLRRDNNDSGLTEFPFFVESASAIDYTFVNCSTTNTTTTMDMFPRYRAVGCLAGENYTVLSTPAQLHNESDLPSSCEEISTVAVPWRFSIEADIRLRWGQPICGMCEIFGQACGFSNDMDLSTACFNLPGSGRSHGPNLRLFLAVGLPVLACIIGLGCLIAKFRAKNRHRQAATSPALSTSVVPRPEIFTAGLDRPTIESYPKILLGESKRLPKPSDNTCPICLCEYQPKESLRTLPQCNHYFHASCVDEWLRLNASCPLCRDSPPSSVL